MGFGRIRQCKMASNSGTTISVTLDKTPVSGNALVAIHHTGSTTSNGVTSSGYGSPVVTLTNATESDETKAHVKIAGGSESTTVTATPASSDENMLIVMEIEGPFTASSQVDLAFAGTRSASAGSYGISGGTPAQAIEAAIAFVMMRTAVNVGLNSWSNDFHQFSMGISSSAKSLALAYKEINSTASLSTTVTFDTANTCMGGMITLKAHADVVAPPTPGDGYWTEIATPAANRALEDVNPDPSGTADYKGSNGQAHITVAWNGGVVRQPAAGGILEYILEACGGHGNYFGNEGYTCDLLAGTIAWARHRDPTPDAADLSLNDTDGVDALGNALSRHTYSYSCYDYDNDEFAFFGGNALAGASAAGSSVVLRLQYGTSKTAWVTTGFANVPAAGGSEAAWHAWYMGEGEHIVAPNNGTSFFRYNRTGNTYTTYANGAFGGTPGGCSLWDSKRGRMVVFGYHASNITILNPNIGGILTQATTSVPGGLDLSTALVGGVYDSYLDKYVFWDGGEDLFMLDPVDYTWSTRSLSTQTVTPTAPATNGTFNRFAYIKPTTDFPEGAYIIVNATNESTYLFSVAPSSGTISGSSAAASSPATAAGTGTLLIQGTSAAQAQPATSVAVGALRVAATSGGQAQPATSSGTGALHIQAASGGQAQPATSSGVGTLLIQAASAGQAQPATSQGVGALALKGASAGASAAATSAGAATLLIQAASAGAAGPATSTGTGSNGVTGSSTAASAPATCAGVGALLIQGASAGAAAAATAAGTGTLLIQGTSAAQAQPATATGTGSMVQDVVGQSAAQAAPATSTGVGTLLTTASGAGAAAPATCTGVGLLLIRAVSAGVAAAATSSATGYPSSNATSAAQASPATSTGAATLGLTGQSGGQAQAALSVAFGYLLITAVSAAQAQAAVCIGRGSRAVDADSIEDFELYLPYTTDFELELPYDS